MTTKDDKKIMITKDGPYLVSGNLPIDKQIIAIGEEGEPEKWVKGKNVPSNKPCALCRCGESKNKPFCDGTHAKVGFKGAETASKKRSEERRVGTEGGSAWL